MECVENNNVTLAFKQSKEQAEQSHLVNKERELGDIRNRLKPETLIVEMKGKIDEEKMGQWHKRTSSYRYITHKQRS